MITIMGATGKVGGAALDILAAGGRQVRALSRRSGTDNRDNVDWKAVDAFDADALAKAFDEAKAVFVLNPVDPVAQDVHAEADRMSEAVATALEEARIPYAVILSSQGGHLSSGTGIVAALHRFEERLKRTNTQLAILRPAYFMESWMPFAGIAAERGALPALIAPPTKAIDCVSARDVGAAAACCLASPQPGVVNLIGPQPYSEADVARILSGILGRPVEVAPVLGEAIAGLHEDAGMSPSFSRGIAGLYAAINADAIPFGGDGVTMRWETPLEDVLRTGLASGRED